MVISGRQLAVVGGVAAGAIGLDQAAKAYVRTHAEVRELRTHDGRVGRLPVVWDPPGTDEFAIVHTENDGMMLGHHGNAGSKQLSGAALVLLPAVAGAMLYAGSTMTGRAAGLARVGATIGAGLVVGGALSNGIEKQVRDQATDFLFISRGTISWNGADVALGVGGAIGLTAMVARLVQGFRR